MVNTPNLNAVATDTFIHLSKREHKLGISFKLYKDHELCK